LPKIAILLAAMDAFEKGELAETEEILSDIRLMISKSNNQASTRMIDRLGYEKIESVLTDPQYELFDEEYGGGLWVGKRYASAGERHPDPLKGLSHAATAEQVARFYYLLAQGKLVSYERSQQMLAIMQDPALHHKFVNTLDQVAPRAKLFRKSGSWKTFHSDSILVWGSGWRHYILVALVDDAQGEQIMRDLVREVETVLHPVK
jgi:beta-lactamase class A